MATKADFQTLPETAIEPDTALRRLAETWEHEDDVSEFVDEMSVTCDEGAKEEAVFLLRQEQQQKAEHALSESIQEEYRTEDPPPPPEFREVEHKLINEKETASCSACAGTGESCDSCSGDGLISCTRDDCYGGTIETRCTRCNGRSYIRVSGDRVDCDECNHAGREPKGPCPMCGDEPPLGQIECDRCDGSGDVDDCSACHGRGDVTRIEYTQITFVPIEKATSEVAHTGYTGQDIPWEVTDEQTVTDDVASETTVETPTEGEICRAQITTYRPVLYEADVTIDGEPLRLIASDEVLETSGRPRAQYHGLLATTGMSLAAFLYFGFYAAVVGILAVPVLYALIGFGVVRTIGTFGLMPQEQYFTDQTVITGYLTWTGLGGMVGVAGGIANYGWDITVAEHDGDE